VDKLRSIIGDPKGPLHEFPILSFPLDPTKQVKGINSGIYYMIYYVCFPMLILFYFIAKCGIFNSNLQPLRLTFECDGTEYPVIFKTGDDLRQDQLVIQIISLMNKLLLKENLDLKLTPYKVLATGPEHGLMQFVPSSSLAAVLNDHQNNVLLFFRKHHPSSEPGNVYGIDPQVMETYTRSCGKYFAVYQIDLH
jgi:phosphatidylinositol 3-kinase